MRHFTSALVAVAVALLAATIAAAQGQVLANRLTNVTFSAPVSVPGHTLPAGTYRFQLADSQANRNIVQIFDKDNNLMATILAVPARRDRAEGEPVVTFKETRSDLPPAVHFWYYAGENMGSELVYPREQALEIARASGEPVMSTDTSSTEANALERSRVTSISPAEANARPTTPAPTTPTTEPTTTAERTAPTTTAEPAGPTYPTATSRKNTTQPQPTGTSGRRRSLPHTASNLPEIGLVGLVALATALGIRFGRRLMV